MEKNDKEKLSLEDLAEASIQYCNMEWGDFCLKLKKAIFGNTEK